MSMSPSILLLRNAGCESTPNDQGVGMKVLFGVASPYQLFNAIILRLSVYAQDECDVRLADFTQWDRQLLERLRASGLFGSAEVVEMVAGQQSFLEDNPPDEIRRIYQDPDAYFTGGPFADPVYDVLCYGVPHLHWRMFYYLECKRGLNPQLYFLEEGIQSYTRDIVRLEQSQKFSAGAYPAGRSFCENINGIYLHRPGLFSVSGGSLRVLKIPSPLDVEGCREKIFEIYGRASRVDADYVYLEDFFFANLLRTNDLELVRALAEIVGVENLVVKRHPRDSVNRFAAFGIRDYPESKFPWEVQLLEEGFSRKTLVSVTSTALYSPFLVYGANMHVISLERMYKGENPELRDSGFVRFMGKVRAMIDADGIRVHRPRNVNELRDVLRYISFVREAEEGKLQ